MERTESAVKEKVPVRLGLTVICAGGYASLAISALFLLSLRFIGSARTE